MNQGDFLDPKLFFLRDKADTHKDKCATTWGNQGKSSIPSTFLRGRSNNSGAARASRSHSTLSTAFNSKAVFNGLGREPYNGFLYIQQSLTHNSFTDWQPNAVS